MTATTANVGLHYPTGTDKPCDGAAQINTLRDDIYNLLDTFDRSIKRQTAGTLPMVSITYTGDPVLLQDPGSSTTTTPFTPIIFNTIEQDDLQAADMIVKNDGITLGSSPDMYGTYIYGFQVIANADEGWTSKVVPNTYDAVALDIAEQQSWDENNINNVPCHAATALLPVPVKTTVGPGLNLSTLFGPVTLYFARLWAVRLGKV